MIDTAANVRAHAAILRDDAGTMRASAREFHMKRGAAMLERYAELLDGDPYDRGRRDMLNALLALNPEAEAKLAAAKDEEPEGMGRLPFDLAFWVTTVADQLGIEPREEAPDAPQG